MSGVALAGGIALAPLMVVQPTLAVGLIPLLALECGCWVETAIPRDLAAGLALLAWAATEGTDLQARAVVVRP